MFDMLFAVYSVISRRFAEKLGLTSFDSGRAYTAQGSYKENEKTVVRLRVTDVVAR